MAYKCEATTVEGFVQLLACHYLRYGYFFYVVGRIPVGKDPREVDAKLIAKYRIDVSQKERCRRKRAGLANMQYVRHGRAFLLLATHGQHRFFEEEAGVIRDARHVSIKFAGYAISHRNGRVCVRIEQGAYKRLKAYFLGQACRRSATTLGREFRGIRYVPYSPVRQQLLQVWRAVNRARKIAGYERVPIGAVPWKRRIGKPFEVVEEGSEQAA
jgi:hypothetical protein